MYISLDAICLSPRAIAQPGSGAIACPPSLQATRIPLQTDLGQMERKYYHAKDFGVTDSRWRAGFDASDRAVKHVLNDPATMHIQGTYRGQPAIIDYNPKSGLCVIQTPDGRFISGWRLNYEQAAYVLNEGKLGGD